MGESIEGETKGGEARGGWFRRLREGLTRTSTRLSDGIATIFTRRRVDDAMLEELEDLLISADLGPATASALTESLRERSFGRELSAEEVRETLAEEIKTLLLPVERPLVFGHATKPEVVLVVGVNGSGKTTTIGKLAQQQMRIGRSVMLVAGDTFRAAAVQQLRVWGERTGCPVISGAEQADPAGLAFDAVTRAREAGSDLLLIDTAGRLHNKAGLMAELEKIIRVLRKQDPTAPHHVLLVLDATTGQNAMNQVATFREVTDVTGLVMTKLDGTARGGILVAVSERFGVPVHAIGVGEGIQDLRPFTAEGFARGLLGLDTVR